jgi:TusA-related sulfurtransferase
VHPAAEVDVRGLACSDAVVRFHKALAPLAPGSLVRATADDPDVVADLKKYAARGGHRWRGMEEGPGGRLIVEVERGV